MKESDGTIVKFAVVRPGHSLPACDILWPTREAAEATKSMREKLHGGTWTIERVVVHDPVTGETL
jgi:hypothetical protein